MLIATWLRDLPWSPLLCLIFISVEVEGFEQNIFCNLQWIGQEHARTKSRKLSGRGYGSTGASYYSACKIRKSLKDDINKFPSRRTWTCGQTSPVPLNRSRTHLWTQAFSSNFPHYTVHFSNGGYMAVELILPWCRLKMFKTGQWMTGLS